MKLIKNNFNNIRFYSSKNHIDWFINNFPKESKDLNFSKPLPTRDIKRLTIAIHFIVLKHPKHIPKLALFYNEIFKIDPLFIRPHQETILQLIQTTIDSENKVKENEIRFWNGLMENELWDIGAYGQITTHIQLLMEHLCYRNVANDIMFLFAVKKFYQRLQTENPRLLNSCLDYVRKLKEDDENEKKGDLGYKKKYLDPDFKKCVDACSAADSHNSFLHLRYSLTYNTLNCARYYLKTLLEHPANILAYIQLVKGFRERDLGTGWFFYHLNKLCYGKFMQYLHRGYYSSVENFNANCILFADRSVVLLNLICLLNEEGKIDRDFMKLVDEKLVIFKKRVKE